DAREELGLVELALDDVALGTDLLAAPLVIGGATRSDQNRRDVAERRVGANALDEREAVHARHFDIDKEQRILSAAGTFQALLGGRCQIDIVAGGLQNTLLEHSGS